MKVRHQPLQLWPTATKPLKAPRHLVWVGAAAPCRMEPPAVPAPAMTATIQGAATKPTGSMMVRAGRKDTAVSQMDTLVTCLCLFRWRGGHGPPGESWTWEWSVWRRGGNIWLGKWLKGPEDKAIHFQRSQLLRNSQHQLATLWRKCPQTQSLVLMFHASNEMGSSAFF